MQCVFSAAISYFEKSIGPLEVALMCFFRRIAVCPHYVQREQRLESLRIGAVLFSVAGEDVALSHRRVCPRKLRSQLHVHNEVLSITVSNCYKMRNSRRPFKTHSAGVYSSSLQVRPGIVPRKAGGSTVARRRDYHLLYRPRKVGDLVSRSLYILAFDPRLASANVSNSTTKFAGSIMRVEYCFSANKSPLHTNKAGM
jgi:hypothetical protein